MKRLLIICILIVCVIFISGCTSEDKTFSNSLTESQNNQNTNSKISNEQTPTDTPTIDLELLKSQGWKIEEFPEFYQNLNFMYNENSIGTIFLQRDNDGNINAIHSISNLDFIKTHSLTVNDITFKNFTLVVNYEVNTAYLPFDVENPYNKNVIFSTHNFRYNEPYYGKQKPSYDEPNKPTTIEIDYSINEISNVYRFNNNKSLFVLDVYLLPTPKKGKKIIQKTDWLSLDQEHKIKFSDFETNIIVKQLRPSGIVEITNNVDGTYTRNPITICLEFKAEDGTIYGYDNTWKSRGYRIDFHKLDGWQLNYYPRKIVGWRATIEETPINT